MLSPPLPRDTPILTDIVAKVVHIIYEISRR
jgi:hypothetical protein